MAAFPALLSLVLICTVRGLDNDVARTPPMGWLSWERFMCNTDCDSEPDECIGERLLTEMADAMVSEGYKDAGYEFINVDDCWPAHDRDPDGNITVDDKRFPSGMKNMINYIHSKGLKFGLYGDVGTKTCAGYPGSQDNYEKDAKRFADWGVDMLKFDGCNINDQAQFEKGYTEMGHALNQTGRHILYSCEWLIYPKTKPDREQVARTCNTFRVYGDIWDDWNSVISIINYYGDNSDALADVAGPGNWNDPDMMTIGNYGLSYEQEKVQMGFWCLFSAPLLMSVDLRRVRDSSKAILQNTAAIAINQDPLGKQARKISQIGDTFQVWLKPVLPAGSFALGIMNSAQAGGPVVLWLNVGSLGMNNTKGYNFTEVFDNEYLGVYKSNDTFTTRVTPTSMKLIRATPLGGYQKQPQAEVLLHHGRKTSKQNGVIGGIINDKK